MTNKQILPKSRKVCLTVAALGVSLFVRLKDKYRAHDGLPHYANIAHDYNKQYTLQVCL